VSAAHAGFLPTITDSVNSGTYAIAYSQYYSPVSTLFGFAYLIANASGTPVVNLAGSTFYSGGQLSYARWDGFSATPTLDATTTSVGDSNTPSGSFTSRGVNELVAALTFGGGSYSTNPPGWNLVTNASGGYIVSPYWVENTAPATASFTGGVLSASEVWFTALAGFSSGPAVVPLGLARQPGPGPSFDRSRTFAARRLAITTPALSNRARGASGALGYATGLATGAIGAQGAGLGAGFALGRAPSSIIGRQMTRGPGPGPDWDTTITQRVLATYAAQNPYGITGARGASVGAGFATAMQLGVAGAIGAGGGFGFASPIGATSAAALGFGQAAGFAFGALISAVGASLGAGYASPGALFPFITLGQAIEILANAGFTVNPIILWQYSSTVPYYYIIGQLPTAGSVIPYQNPPVQLTVSAGPAPPVPSLVTVPNLVGQPLLFAIEILTEAYLNIGTVTYVQSATSPINSVVAQAPAPLTQVPQYSGVNLTACSGPVMDKLIGDPYTVPNVT
jgi:hypothetical protein